MALAFRTLLKALPSSAAALDLAFDRGVVDSKVTFTRASSALYVDSAGVYQTALTDVPRIDYDPVTLACRGLLIEEQRTNLLTYSQEFDNAGWPKSGSTVSANATTGPDGASTAEKIQEDATTANHLIQQGPVVVSGTTYTASVWLKSAERGFALLALTTAFPTTAIQINLSTGAVSTGTGTPLTAFSVQYAGGWWRVGFSLAATSSAACQMNIYCSTDGLWANRSYTGTTGNGIYAWGAQLEAGSFATSYIPTTGATATRAADIAVVSGANFSGFYNSAAGSVVAEYVVLAASTSSSRYAYSADDGTANNRISQFAVGTGATWASRHVVGGSASNPANSSSYTAANTVQKVGASAITGAMLTSFGGTTGPSSTPAGMPTLTALNVGNSHIGAEQLNGYIRRIRYYPRALSQAELNALTT